MKYANFCSIVSLSILLSTATATEMVELNCSTNIACPGEPVLCQCLVAVNISTGTEALIWFLDGQTHHFSHNNPIIDSTVNITDRAQVTLVSINDTHIISVLKLNVQSGDVVVCKNGFLGTAYNKTVTLTVAEKPAGLVNISVQLHQDTAVVNLTSHESGSGVATSFDLVLSPPHNSCSEPINEKCHISVDKAGLVTLKGLEPETQYTVQVTPINCAGQGNRSEPVEFNSTKAIEPSSLAGPVSVKPFSVNYTLNESCVIDFQLTRVQWIDIFYGNTSLNSRVSRSSTNMRVNLCSFNPSCNSMVKDNLTLLFRDPNGKNHSQLIPLNSTECCCTSGGQILSPLKAVFLTCLLAVSILWLF